jgi:hypothetical protein
MDAGLKHRTRTQNIVPKTAQNKTLEEKPKKLPQEASKGKMRFPSLKLRTQHEARLLACLLA